MNDPYQKRPFAGCWAYHLSCPQGRIFRDEMEYLEAKQNGWVDAPPKPQKEEPIPTPLKKKRGNPNWQKREQPANS